MSTTVYTYNDKVLVNSANDKWLKKGYQPVRANGYYLKFSVSYYWGNSIIYNLNPNATSLETTARGLTLESINSQTMPSKVVFNPTGPSYAYLGTNVTDVSFDCYLYQTTYEYEAITFTFSLVQMVNDVETVCDTESYTLQEVSTPYTGTMTLSVNS